MTEKIKKISIGSILFCCCFGFVFVISAILTKFFTIYEVGVVLGFLTGFCGVFFVMIFDAIIERMKKNKLIKENNWLEKEGDGIDCKTKY